MGMCSIRSRLISMALVGLSVVLWSCASSRPTREELNELKTQLSDLQKVVSSHTAQMELLEKQQKKPEPVFESEAAVETELAKPEAPTDVDVEAVAAELDDWSDRKLFDSAFLLKKSEGKKAGAQFAKLVKRFPTSPLADNALFWLGMIQFDGGEYHRAVVFWDKILRDYPKGNKVPDALLEMARGYQKLNQPDKVKLALDRLQQDHKGSKAASMVEKFQVETSN